MVCAIWPAEPVTIQQAVISLEFCIVSIQVVVEADGVLGDAKQPLKLYLAFRCFRLGYLLRQDDCFMMKATTPSDEITGEGNATFMP